MKNFIRKYFNKDFMRTHFNEVFHISLGIALLVVVGPISNAIFHTGLTSPGTLISYGVMLTAVTMSYMRYPGRGRRRASKGKGIVRRK